MIAFNKSSASASMSSGENSRMVGRQAEHQQAANTFGTMARTTSQDDPSRDALGFRVHPAVTPMQRIEQRVREADLLLRAGEFAACLKLLLNIYDFHRHELRDGSHWLGVLLARVAQLGGQYPPATEALLSRRERLESLVIEGIGDRSTVIEFHAINRVLHETERTIDLFRRLDAMGPKQRQLQADLAVVVLEQLVGQRRYAAALEHEATFRSRLADLFGSYQALQRQSEPLAGIDGLFPAGISDQNRHGNDAEPPREIAPATSEASPIDQVRNRALHLAGLYFEALVGVGDVVAIEDFVDELQSVFSQDELRPKLARHVLHANPDAAGIILDRIGIGHDG